MLHLIYLVFMLKEHYKPLLFILIHARLSGYCIYALHSIGDYGMFYRNE